MGFQLEPGKQQFKFCWNCVANQFVGLTQFQNVLDAQRTLLTYQNYLVQALGGSLIYLVQLYEALGGGW